MDLELRQARLQDAAAMVELLAPIVAHGGLTAMEGPLTIEDQRAFIAAFPARGVFTVALAGGRLVGMQDVTPLESGSPALAHVGQISTFVSMAHQGQGVGRRLCQETFAQARSLGFTRLQATIRADNPRAVAFYQSQGFRQVGTLAQYLQVDGAWIDGVLAERPLESPMELIFYDEPDPRGRLAHRPRSIFLAGPTSRGVQRTAWRAEALAWLERQGFDGAVVIPEFEARPFDEAAPLTFGAGRSPVVGMSARSHHILAWETAGIEGVGVVLFWMPFSIGHIDDPASLPGFTTRAEVSREVARDPSRVVLGMPRGSLSGSHIRYHAAAAGLTVHATLEATLQAALDHLDRHREAP